MNFRTLLFISAAWGSCGCEGADYSDAPPSTPEVDPATTPKSPQGEVLDALPRCVDSPEPAAGLCQEMRFGERVGFDTESWCAFWVHPDPDGGCRASN